MVSSGQQVTGYAHNDSNNHWQIIPTKALPETGRGRIVRHDDVIQLLHVNTDTNLLTHDVASPLMPTNQEFTTWPNDDLSRYNDTLFEVVLVDGEEGDAWKSKSGHFRLVHVPTRVSLWTHKQNLPDWAFKQQEINGNKNAQERTATWFVDEIIADESKSFGSMLGKSWTYSDLKLRTIQGTALVPLRLRSPSDSISSRNLESCSCL